MVHGVHPILPFDIIQATFLGPVQDFGITTEELIASRAQLLEKRPEEIDNMKHNVEQVRIRYIQQFEKRHGSRIIDFDFKPGSLVLVRNSRIEESLNRKTKPRYVGPMVVVRKTKNKSYLVAELDGTQSELRVAGFRLIPYFPRTTTDHVIDSGVSEEDDTTREDPEDVLFFESLSSTDGVYELDSIPTF
jgi:hypothetical protein